MGSNTTLLTHTTVPYSAIVRASKARKMYELVFVRVRTKPQRIDVYMTNGRLLGALYYHRQVGYIYRPAKVFMTRSTLEHEYALINQKIREGLEILDSVPEWKQ